jgi:2-phospho-L-lactate guanylyltransferase
MLFDVVDAVSSRKAEIIVLVPKITAKLLELKNRMEQYGIIFKEDPSGLNEAINALIAKETAVIMSDLPLLTPQVLQGFFECKGDIVLSPGRKGGTNMLLIRDSRFKVSYHHGSFFKHLRIAKRLGIKATVFDSFYASLDIDDESDLLELMLHGYGRKSWKYLIKIGFGVDFSKKIPTMYRRAVLRVDTERRG